VDEIKGGLVQGHAVDGGPQVDDVTLLAAGGVEALEDFWRKELRPTQQVLRLTKADLVAQARQSLAAVRSKAEPWTERKSPIVFRCRE
jgi:hypothetical protein